MSKMKLNAIVSGFTGRLGNMVHRELWGRHVVSRPPDFSKRVLTDKQLAENRRFTAAAEIWRGLDPEVKAAYKAWAKQENRPPYALFTRNGASPPTVEQVDLSQYTGRAEQLILVYARDLFDVAAVEVVVRDAQGNVVEKGAAAKAHEQQWTYETTVDVIETAGVTVEAAAVNWPGKHGNRIELLASAG